MNKTDDLLRKQVSSAMPRSATEPSFEETWRAAQNRCRSRSYRLHLAAAAAVTAVAVAVIVNVSRPPEETLEYINVSELMGSTSWAAPSDALLPEHRFDIYRNVPSLTESTETDGGALL